MKTEHQLRLILEKREIPSEIAEPLLARFVEAQLIDDLQYAKSFVSSRLAAGGKSAALLRRELKQKGVSPDLVDLALADLDQEQEFALALRLVQSRYQRMSKLEPDVIRRRLFGLLLRRGFSGSTASRAIAAAVVSE